MPLRPSHDILKSVCSSYKIVRYQSGPPCIRTAADQFESGQNQPWNANLWCYDINVSNVGRGQTERFIHLNYLSDVTIHHTSRIFNYEGLLIDCRGLRFDRNNQPSVSRIWIHCITEGISHVYKIQRPTRCFISLAFVASFIVFFFNSSPGAPSIAGRLSDFFQFTHLAHFIPMQFFFPWSKAWRRVYLPTKMRADYRPLQWYLLCNSRWPSHISRRTNRNR